MIRTIRDECKKLLNCPEIGREIIKTLKHSIRQIVFNKYRIFYRKAEKGIGILSIKVQGFGKQLRSQQFLMIIMLNRTVPS